MTPRSRIVAGFDGSSGAWAAVRYAADEAAADGGTVHLVHALMDHATYTEMLLPDLVDDARAGALRLLEAARDDLRLRQPGLDVRVTIVERAPGPALVRASRSADMVVVGRHGLGTALPSAPFQRAHLGAVTAHLMTYVSCPVVVVGPGAAGVSDRPVVLGLDAAAAPSAPLIAYAFDAARRHGSVLRVCSVRVPTGTSRHDDGNDRPDDAQLRRLLGEALSDWRAVFADVPVALDVLEGVDPAARLLDAATGASLVVVGAHEHGTRPAGLSPAPDVLVRNATCPVAVVPPRPGPHNGRRGQRCASSSPRPASVGPVTAAAG
ncbi:universal stress protein [Dactylosporangium fulvum]|uniref:Universal stress protein n=1 Tax=Dactylosporangium fulvum TaxID=53359 RepID=A0ABY5VPD0_9ACTN|nr:universal stress protein [Dactylosporangium fulvum]UWP79607.1 universal stress protein [Dactylosporangium fulvum]